MNFLILVTFLSILFPGFFGPDFSDAEKLYRTGEYQKSYEMFTGLGTNPENLHNIGNTLFYLSQSGSLNEILEKSLLSYEASLKQEENPLTRANYEYVKKLLEQKKQGQESQKQEENTQEQNQESQTENQKSQSGSSDSESKDEETQNNNTASDSGEAQAQKQISGGERGEEYMLKQGQELETMTQKERQELEAYAQRLQQEETQNRMYFGKKQQAGETLTDSLFQDFFGASPLFEQDFGSGEKDW